MCVHVFVYVECCVLCLFVEIRLMQAFPTPGISSLPLRRETERVGWTQPLCPYCAHTAASIELPRQRPLAMEKMLYKTLCFKGSFTPVCAMKKSWDKQPHESTELTDHTQSYDQCKSADLRKHCMILHPVSILVWCMSEDNGAGRAR